MAGIACVWMGLMSVVLMFPSSPTLGGVDEMNYTVVVQGGVMVLSLVYYWFPWGYGGVYWFKGPVPTVGKDGSGGSVEKGGEGEESERSSQQEKEKVRVVVEQQAV